MTSQADTDSLPGISVVIATRGRPQLLRAAVRAALEQDYRGSIEVIVVYDHIDIDALEDVEVLTPPERGARALRSIPNTRTQGLAGARNSGIMSTTHHFVAFCDDDDEWMPSKITAQVGLLQRNPECSLVATGIRIKTSGESHVRLPPPRVGFDDLLRSRITEMHPSSFLVRRADLLGSIGLIDEELPASYGEDYDLLLRAASHGDIVSVVKPLVIIHWDRASFFNEKWEGIANGLSYLLAKHPEFERSPRGAARIEGQIAFAQAAMSNWPGAKYWAMRALRHDRAQLRAYASILVAMRLLPVSLLVRAVNRRGHGL